MPYHRNIHLKSGKRLFYLVIFSVLSLTSASQATELVDRAREVGFIPHKALYDIQLAGTRSGSQIANISGQMFYEWDSSCDAWIANHRFNLFYEYADSPAMRITSDFSTFETFDGKSMDFTSQRKRDGQLFEELRGRAELNGEGEVVYTKPKDLVYDLPEGTLFPMAHTLDVLANMKAGKKFYTATIFDGSDEDGPVEINAFIGKEIDPLAGISSSDDLDMDLLQTKARQIRLAFFPLKNPEAASDYEMTLTFLDNGIITDMLIEYDDFTVSQKLIALEALNGTCENVRAE